MNKKKLIFLSLLLSLFFSTLSLAETIVNKLGMEFLYPDGWYLLQQPNSNNLYIKHPENKAVISVGWRKGFFSNQPAFALFLFMYRNESKPTEERIIFLNVPCHIFIFETLNEKGAVVKIKDYVFLKNGKVYHITYTTFKEDFNIYLPEFEKVIASFKLLE